MLTTTQKNFLDVDVLPDSTTVSFSPGTVETGSTISIFRGENRYYSQLIDVSDATNKYKYSLYYIQDVSSSYAMSAAATLKKDLIAPSIPVNSSPVALFTFFSDGTNISVDSFEKVNR